MWRYTCSWIDWPSAGPFQYKTLSSTCKSTHSGTEGFHINENARVVNVLRLLLLLLLLVVTGDNVEFNLRADHGLHGLVKD